MQSCYSLLHGLHTHILVIGVVQFGVRITSIAWAARTWYVLTPLCGATS